MKWKDTLSRSTMLAGAFAAGIFTAPRPAAGFGFDGAAIVAAVNSMSNVMNGAIGKVESAVQSGLSALNGLTGNGFTQLSNYLKAQTGAQEQIANANNLVQARLARDVRDAALRDDFTPSRESCLALDGGQAVVVAARNADDVSSALTAAKTERGEAGPNTPSWPGGAQGAQAANAAHNASYCDAADAEAGVCALAQSPAAQDADQDARNLLGVPAYADQTAIDKANAFETNLIQPVAPADLRGDARKSGAGQNMMPFRRSYNSAMSLAHLIANDALASHALTVTLTPAQKEEAAHEGLPAAGKASTNEATELEVNRRYSGLQYQKDLQAMSPGKQVQIEQITLLAQQNWLLWQQYKLEQKMAVALARLLADSAEDHFKAVPTLAPPQAQ